MICYVISSKRQEIEHAVKRCQADQIRGQVTVTQLASIGARLAHPLEQQAERDRIDFGDTGKIDLQRLRTIHHQIPRQQLLDVIEQEIAADQPFSLFLRNINHGRQFKAD